MYNLGNASSAASSPHDQNTYLKASYRDSFPGGQPTISFMYGGSWVIPVPNTDFGFIGYGMYYDYSIYK